MCKDTTSGACERNVGAPPALSLWSDTTGQRVQFYDARLVKEVQRPHFAMMTYDDDDVCTQITVGQIVASEGDLEG